VSTDRRDPAAALAAPFAIASTSWHNEGMTVKSIGDYIREQREQARISMRQLAQQAGVSNPYLSQIERGLRKPSADILQQIAKGLRISAEALYVQAGILEDRPADSGVRSALLADPELSERQKQVLIEIYESFRKENAALAEAEAAEAEVAQAAAEAAAETKASKTSWSDATAEAEQDERSGDVGDVSGQMIPSD
jgi:transcriptional regulator with XRE-family HTH domain